MYEDPTISLKLARGFPMGPPWPRMMMNSPGDQTRVKLSSSIALLVSNSKTTDVYERTFSAPCNRIECGRECAYDSKG
jgi:hypothetical protein